MNVLLRMCPKRFGRASEHTLVEMDKSMRYMVFLSFMEVYNEQVSMIVQPLAYDTLRM